MSEENKNNEEIEQEVTETAEEAVTEAIEETAEEAVTEAIEKTAEEAVTEAVEKTAEDVAAEEAKELAQDAADEAVTEVIEEVAETINGEGDKIEEPKKDNSKYVVIGIIVAVLVAVAVFFALNASKLFNKYNRMGYIDTTGRTIEEVADQNGYELADFLAEYGLPADMPGSTYESTAYYTIPVSKITEMYGMDFASMKEMFGWDDTITEETTWGEAEGETAIGKYVGEENVDRFKEEYSLGDDVTGETKWKEIRNIVDQATRDKRIEQEKAMAAPTEEAADDAQATEAPADGAAADGAQEPNAEATAAPAE